VVVTKDLQLICRHEPNLNDTTDAWDRFRWAGILIVVLKHNFHPPLAGSTQLVSLREEVPRTVPA
jgi:glycerophosphoryl diester phosphodiesterase